MKPLTDTPGTPLNRSLRQSILRFVRSRVKNDAVAEDLTQDILLKAAVARTGLRQPSKMDAWIFRIARNRVNDYFRTSRETVLFDERLHADSAQPERHGASRDEDRALRADLSAFVRQVVDELPPHYRDALLATEFEGISQVEYAARAGLSVPAAKSRVQRGRKEVRRVFERCCEVTADAYGTIVDARARRPAECEFKTCKDPKP